MRCLYCGKELALFKRLRGGEFCSDAHRQRYQEEYTQLALNRLLQANPPSEQESNPKEIQAAAEAPAPNGTSKLTSVLDPVPAALAPAAEPPPAGMSSFLVEAPVAVVFETAALVDSSANLTPASGPALPRLREFPRETRESHLEPAGRMPLNWFAPADFQTPLRERGLELREFVRGVPQAEIRIRPASKAGFEPTREAMEARFDARPPEESPRVWQASEGLPALGGTAEILLGDLARLDFAVTGLDAASVEQPAPANELPSAVARLEPMRVEPIQLVEPILLQSSRPQPLHFEPVHVDPVFMERVAGAVQERPGLSNDRDLEETQAAASTQAAPAPPTITKPVPVTLHGLAPSRGKPVQVFPSAVSRGGEIQVPRETGLPLRPVMVWGPAPKPASVPSSVPSIPGEKAPAGKPVKSIPVSRAIEVKPRRSEIRVLPDAPVERPSPAPPVRAAEPVPAKARPPIAPPPAEADLLGLPKLSLQNSESFWTRLPVVARIGAIAAVLALLVGGVILTSRGAGAPRSAAPADSEPQVVEAGAPLENTAGWMQDWFADRPNSRQEGRHVDILRGSLTLRDYRLVFEGQIEQGALGWVFRAYDKSFYVEKIQVITPGREPVVALVHFAVIDGWEQPRTQTPLPIHAHLDTTYKVRMDVVGNRFTTWVQDQKVDQWTDNQIAAGGVGLYYDSGDSANLRDTLNVIPLKLK